MAVPDDIVYMLKRPGKYAVSVDIHNAGYLMVEVDEEGNVHQLTPNGSRDGTLSRDAWNPNIRVYTRTMEGTVEAFVRINHPNPQGIK